MTNEYRRSYRTPILINTNKCVSKTHTHRTDKYKRLHYLVNTNAGVRPQTIFRPEPPMADDLTHPPPQEPTLLICLSSLAIRRRLLKHNPSQQSSVWATRMLS